MFCHIWEFKVNPMRVEEFESAYGSDGPWTELFRRAPGFIRTEILRDLEENNRYFTIDYWTDRDAYEGFRQDFSAEFQSLDKDCEAFTISERHVGDFEILQARE